MDSDNEPRNKTVNMSTKEKDVKTMSAAVKEANTLGQAEAKAYITHELVEPLLGLQECHLTVFMEILHGMVNEYKRVRQMDNKRSRRTRSGEGWRGMANPAGGETTHPHKATSNLGTRKRGGGGKIEDHDGINHTEQVSREMAYTGKEPQAQDARAANEGDHQRDRAVMEENHGRYGDIQKEQPKEKEKAMANTTVQTRANKEEYTPAHDAITSEAITGIYHNAQAALCSTDVQHELPSSIVQQPRREAESIAQQVCISTEAEPEVQGPRNSPTGARANDRAMLGQRWEDGNRAPKSQDYKTPTKLELVRVEEQIRKTCKWLKNGLGEVRRIDIGGAGQRFEAYMKQYEPRGDIEAVCRELEEGSNQLYMNRANHTWAKKLLDIDWWQQKMRYENQHTNNGPVSRARERMQGVPSFREWICGEDTDKKGRISNHLRNGKKWNTLVGELGFGILLVRHNMYVIHPH